MTSVELVILDCDGVLVDSERVTTALLAEVVTELGWPMSAGESTTRFKGRDLHEIQAEIEERIGRRLGEKFIPDYRVRMAERFSALGVPPIEGAGDLLDWLDERRVLHAVASNAPHEKMAQTLGRIALSAGHASGALDWYGRFDGRRFSAYDIQKWKPDPGLFLHAAGAMGAPAEASVVVEDSVSGVRAAAAAGMRAIGFADLTPAHELREAGATEVVGSIAEAFATLRAWVD